MRVITQSCRDKKQLNKTDLTARGAVGNLHHHGYDDDDDDDGGGGGGGGDAALCALRILSVHQNPDNKTPRDPKSAATGKKRWRAKEREREEWGRRTHQSVSEVSSMTSW